MLVSPSLQSHSVKLAPLFTVITEPLPVIRRIYPFKSRVIYLPLSISSVVEVVTLFCKVIIARALEVETSLA